MSVRMLRRPLPVSMWLLRIAFVVGTLLATLVTALAIFQMAYGDRVLPGVRVWGVDVSGMTIEAAGRRLQQHFAYVSDPILTLHAFGQTWNAAPTELGVRVDVDATVRAAYRLGRGGSALNALSSQFDMMTNGAEAAPVVVFDPSVAAAYVEARAAELNVEPRDASVSLDGLTVVVTPAQNGRALDAAATLTALESAARALRPATIELSFVERPARIIDVTSTAQQLQTLVSRPFTLFLESPRPGDAAASWDMPLEQLASLARVRSSADGLSLAVTLDRDALTAGWRRRTRASSSTTTRASWTS